MAENDEFGRIRETSLTSGGGRADRRDDVDIPRAPVAQHSAGDACRLPGRDSLVDEEDVASLHPGKGKIEPIERDPTSDFAPSGFDFGVDRVLGDLERFDRPGIEVIEPAFDRRADRGLGVTGRFDFPRDKDFHRDSEPPGDLVGDDDPAAREAEDDRIDERAVPEALREESSGFGPIGESSAG